MLEHCRGESGGRRAESTGWRGRRTSGDGELEWELQRGREEGADLQFSKSLGHLTKQVGRWPGDRDH